MRILTTHLSLDVPTYDPTIDPIICIPQPSLRILFKRFLVQPSVKRKRASEEEEVDASERPQSSRNDVKSEELDEKSETKLLI